MPLSRRRRLRCNSSAAHRSEGVARPLSRLMRRQGSVCLCAPTRAKGTTLLFGGKPNFGVSIRSSGFPLDVSKTMDDSNSGSMKGGWSLEPKSWEAPEAYLGEAPWVHLVFFERPDVRSNGRSELCSEMGASLSGEFPVGRTSGRPRARESRSTSFVYIACFQIPSWSMQGCRGLGRAEGQGRQGEGREGQAREGQGRRRAPVRGSLFRAPPVFACPCRFLLRGFASSFCSSSPRHSSEVYTRATGARGGGPCATSA